MYDKLKESLTFSLKFGKMLPCFEHFKKQQIIFAVIENKIYCGKEMRKVGVKISCKECGKELFEDRDLVVKFTEEMLKKMITITDLEKCGIKVNFFCDECDEEIFQGMDENIKETEMITDILQKCTCSDCILKQAREEVKEASDSEE